MDSTSSPTPKNKKLFFVPLRLTGLWTPPWAFDSRSRAPLVLVVRGGERRLADNNDPDLHLAFPMFVLRHHELPRGENKITISNDMPPGQDKNTRAKLERDTSCR